jgi:hypothetical protein
MICFVCFTSNRDIVRLRRAIPKVLALIIWHLLCGTFEDLHQSIVRAFENERDDDAETEDEKEKKKEWN